MRYIQRFRSVRIHKSTLRHVHGESTAKMMPVRYNRSNLDGGWKVHGE